MFGLADMIVVEGFNRAFANLRYNPHHLEFITCGYHDTPFLKSLHGEKYIEQIVKLITENKVFIEPGYRLDAVKFPSIAVIASYTESDQFIGDYGDSFEQTVINPIVYKEFDAKGFSEDKKSLIVSKELGVQEVAYPGRVLRAPSGTKYRIVQTEIKDTSVEIFVDVEIDQLLQGWKIQSVDTSKVAAVNTSLSTADVSIQLTTTGDIEVHKLLALVCRYALKWNRKFFESQGLQVSTSSQRYPIITDETQSIIQTQFNLSGKIADSWIIQETVNPAELDYTLCVVPDKNDESKEHVGPFQI